MIVHSGVLGVLYGVLRGVGRGLRFLVLLQGPFVTGF